MTSVTNPPLPFPINGVVFAWAMALVTEIMGMNMEDLPGLKESFYIVMVLMAMAGAGVYLGLKIRKIV
jgi:Mg2+ and Co2+ transporter CorA